MLRRALLLCALCVLFSALSGVSVADLFSVCVCFGCDVFVVFLRVAFMLLCLLLFGVFAFVCLLRS